MATVVLTAETGVGLQTSNSYATAVEFDLYMWRIPLPYKIAFTAISTDTLLKEQVLIWSTQLLVNNLVWPCDSYRKFETQALDFPRYGLVSPDGFLVGESSVPQFMKDATCQLAFELLKSDLTVEPTRGLASITVGPISLDFDVNHPTNINKIIPRSVMTILYPYGITLRGQSGIRSVPLYRS